jgi:hypothetical protein
MSAVAIQIDHIAPPGPAAAFAEFIAAITDTDARAQDAVQRATQAMDNAEAKLRAGLAMLDRTLTLGEKAVAAGIPVEVEAAIERAERGELHIRAEGEQVKEVIERIRRMLAKISPRAARQFKPVMARFDAVMAWYLAELQDARWRVMVMRAEQQRSEIGPVFETPEELARYLDHLRN